MDPVQTASATVPAPVTDATPSVQAVSAAPPAADTSSAKTIYSDRVANAVATLASGSGASLDDQIKAYVNLQDLITNGAKLYKAGNQDDLNSALDAYHNSDLSKKMNQVSAQYQRIGMAGSGLDNPPQYFLDTLNKFSSDDQKLLFVSLMGNANYDSVADWKAGIAQDAANWDPNSHVATSGTVTVQQVAARYGLTDATSTDSDTVSLSPAAQLAVANSAVSAPAASDTSKSALQTLTGGTATVTAAGVALTLLTSATTKDSDKSDVKDADTAASTQKAYDPTGATKDVAATSETSGAVVDLVA